MRGRAKILGVVTAILAVLSVGVSVAGCGNSEIDKSEVTLRVRPEGSAERQLLGQIYAQALKAAGYRVRIGSGEFGSAGSLEEIKERKLAGTPEYLSTILFYEFGVEIENIPTETHTAYGQLRLGLDKQGLVAFPPAPYSIENVVGMLRKTAEERGLKKNSDLKGKAEKMTIKAPTYCHVSVECMAGIEASYGTHFESISYEKALSPELSWWRTEPDFRYEVLEDGEADASILYNTDGRLATEGDKFIILEDDKHIFPASNFVWITSQDVVDEAGPDYEKTIVAAQKGLTLPVIQRLNAKMEAGKTPAEAASEYLQSVGFAR
jgi:osmoprotectant transport system substrate-binding protein